MIIWRVERDGKGPYSSTMVKLASLDNDLQPLPREDGFETIHKWLFGFQSLKHFMDWFVNDLLTLADQGFTLNAYKVREFTTGEKQVMFNPKTSQMLDVFDIREFT